MLSRKTRSKTGSNRQFVIHSSLSPINSKEKRSNALLFTNSKNILLITLSA